MKITTKTGDKGETSLFGGKRVSKSSEYIEAVGELDELQAFVGWAFCACDEDECAAVLKKVQDDLYKMMAIVGFEMKAPKGMEDFGHKEVEYLESKIEEGQEFVKDLNEFIRPGKNELAARLHVARTVCRRVERAFVRSNFIDSEEILKYLNRLSDLLFILAFATEKK